MKDPISQLAAEQIVDLANVGGTMHVNDILPIVAEACRKVAENDEELFRKCLETLTDGETSEPHSYLPTINALRLRLSNSLTPKETKD